MVPSSCRASAILAAFSASYHQVSMIPRSYLGLIAGLPKLSQWAIQWLALCQLGTQKCSARSTRSSARPATSSSSRDLARDHLVDQRVDLRDARRPRDCSCPAPWPIPSRRRSRNSLPGVTPAEKRADIDVEVEIPSGAAHTGRDRPCASWHRCRAASGSSHRARIRRSKVGSSIRNFDGEASRPWHCDARVPSTLPAGLVEQLRRPARSILRSWPEPSRLRRHRDLVEDLGSQILSRIGSRSASSSADGVPFGLERRVLEEARRAIIEAVEQIGVRPFEIEGEIERLADPDVLELLAPQIEEEALRAGWRLVGKFALDARGRPSPLRNCRRSPSRARVIPRADRERRAFSASKPAVRSRKYSIADFIEIVAARD